MELIDTIHLIVKQTLDAMKLTDYVAGTVVATNPLSISLSANMPPIPAEAIILTDSVKKRIVDGVEVQSDLAVGDAVTMLRVSRGQQFIVLSKVVG